MVIALTISRYVRLAQTAATLPLRITVMLLMPAPLATIGVSFSLVDSMVFITDMQLVDSITIEKKTKFLVDRQLYSFQFQRYLEGAYKGGPYVPSVFFSPSRKKMERKYLSLHKRYVQSKDLRMILVDISQFRFKPEKYIEETTE